MNVRACSQIWEKDQLKFTARADSQHNFTQIRRSGPVVAVYVGATPLLKITQECSTLHATQCHTHVDGSWRPYISSLNECCQYLVTHKHTLSYKHTRMFTNVSKNKQYIRPQCHDITTNCFCNTTRPGDQLIIIIRSRWGVMTLNTHHDWRCKRGIGAGGWR